MQAVILLVHLVAPSGSLTHGRYESVAEYEVASLPDITDDDQVDSVSQLVGNLDRAIGET